MRTTLTIRFPKDYQLARDFCSYGYFLLEPNHWEPETQTVSRVLNLEGGPAHVEIVQTTIKPEPKLRARFDRSLTRPEQAEARQKISRMLSLDVTHDEIKAFHKVDPRWTRAAGGAGRGRLSRSPTLFEDIVKTVTSCNVAWPSTINMNRRLCEVLGTKSDNGHHAFPTPQKLARTRPGTLRARCRVGYRDQRLIDLAKLYNKGEICETWLTADSTTDDEAFKFLLTLPGVGPYAAGNIMQLLGRFSRLALDSESVRHGKAVLGLTGKDTAILKRMTAHYEPFGEHKFRSYWFEIWAWYEIKAGKSWTWEKKKTASSFTAAKLK
ncbi:MAG: 3-methyladenine DNA glycosylase/8-oxoguanine DNA glycosylase [Phycisphaerales bacterium]|jgi:3-methyladenine DNA glycosylase/8-oxoguanine DNA glycosylase